MFSQRWAPSQMLQDLMTFSSGMCRSSSMRSGMTVPIRSSAELSRPSFDGTIPAVRKHLAPQATDEIVIIRDQDPRAGGQRLDVWTTSTTTAPRCDDGGRSRSSRHAYWPQANTLQRSGHCKGCRMRGRAAQVVPPEDRARNCNPGADLHWERDVTEPRRRSFPNRLGSLWRPMFGRAPWRSHDFVLLSSMGLGGRGSRPVRRAPLGGHDVHSPPCPDRKPRGLRWRGWSVRTGGHGAVAGHPEGRTVRHECTAGPFRAAAPARLGSSSRSPAGGAQPPGGSS